MFFTNSMTFLARLLTKTLVNSLNDTSRSNALVTTAHKSHSMFWEKVSKMSKKKMGDNCDSCSKDYFFIKGQDKISLYMTDTKYTHIDAICPWCKATTRIFLPPATVVEIVARNGIGFVVGLNPPTQVSDDYKALYESDSIVPEPDYELPELTAEERRQVTDDIRRLYEES